MLDKESYADRSYKKLWTEKFKQEWPTRNLTKEECSSKMSEKEYAIQKALGLTSIPLEVEVVFKDPRKFKKDHINE